MNLPLALASLVWLVGHQKNLIRPAKDTNLIRTKGKSGYRLNLVLLFTYFQLAFIDYFLSKLLFINLVFLLIVDGVNI